MNNKDKQILKDTIIVIIDQIASNTPAFNIAWGLSKSLYGAGIKLRQQKALEWVEMVRDNPSIFTETILKDENFQDGFVYSFEKYLQEKNKVKRKYMRDIFLEFAKSNKDDQFEIERMYHILSILNLDDFLILKDIDINNKDFHQIYKEKDSREENIYNLVNAGILMADYSARFGPINSPFVKITEFGKKFIEFIKK